MVIKNFYVILILVIFLSPNINAYLGVTPAIQEINFEPGLTKGFTFNFRTDQGTELDIFAEGDLAKYVKLSTKKLVGGGNVKVLLEFPEKIEKPGLHRISIGAREIIKKEGGAVGAAIDLRAVIKVRVPYPGEYAEIKFSTSNANQGEDIYFNLKIYSRGEKTIFTNSYVEIYKLTETSNIFRKSKIQEDLVETLNLGTNSIDSTKSVEIKKSWDTTNQVSGKYKAVGIVEYGEQRVDKGTGFKIGELYIEVVNYTKEFEKDKINKFDITIESFWNDPIEDIFANVSIIDSDISFLTPSINVDGFSKNILTGHLDTSSIEDSKFKAKIVLYYSEKTTEKIVDLRFKREINYLLIGIIIGIIVIITLLATILIKMRKSKKRK